jgi:hypothetical protein
MGYRAPPERLPISINLQTNPISICRPITCLRVVHTAVVHASHQPSCVSQRTAVPSHAPMLHSTTIRHVHTLHHGLVLSRPPQGAVIARAILYYPLPPQRTAVPSHDSMLHSTTIRHVHTLHHGLVLSRPSQGAVMARAILSYPLLPQRTAVSSHVPMLHSTTIRHVHTLHHGLVLPRPSQGAVITRAI